MLKKLLSLILAAICVIALGGCMSDAPQSGDGYTVTDARGKTLHIKEKPKRIISTYIFADEILLDLVSHDRIVAMDKWIHDPGLSMAVESAKDVTTEVDNSPEYMISLRPDLVVVGESQIKMVQSLESAGLPVFVYKDAKLIKDIPDEIRSLGRAVGENDRAETLIAEMESRLRDIDKKVAVIPENQKKRVMLVLRFGPIGGEGNIFHDVLTRAGTIDVYNDVRPPALSGNGTSMILSKEEFVQSDPDMLIMGNWSQGGAFKDSEQQLQEMYENPAYSSMRAIRDKQVVILPQRNVNCLSHHVTEGIETVYQAVYEGKGSAS